LCELANEDPDINPSALDAREKFFWWVVRGSKSLGILGTFGIKEGYFWAGSMLEHFLNKDQHVEVRLPYNTTFQSDYGIRRTILEKLPPVAQDDEPVEITPLLYFFLEEVKSMNKCDKYIVLPTKKVSNKHTYTPRKSMPRPINTGWWGAFGHIDISAEYRNAEVMKMPIGGYVIRTHVNYHVDDQYEWFPGEKGTPLPIGNPVWGDPPANFVSIPHEWEGSLVEAGRAREYDYTIDWYDNLQILVLDDFSQFFLVGESDWISLK
jgi:hypothetical protein